MCIKWIKKAASLENDDANHNHCYVIRSFLRGLPRLKGSLSLPLSFSEIANKILGKRTIFSLLSKIVIEVCAFFLCGLRWLRSLTVVLINCVSM